MIKDRAAAIERLKARRIAIGLPCSELARLIGISRIAVYKWETLQVLPSERRIEQYRKALRSCELGKTRYTNLVGAYRIRDDKDIADIATTEQIDELRALRLLANLSTNEVSRRLHKYLSFWCDVESHRNKCYMDTYNQAYRIIYQHWTGHSQRRELMIYNAARTHTKMLKVTDKQHDEILRALKHFGISNGTFAQILGCSAKTISNKRCHSGGAGFYPDEYIALRDYILRHIQAGKKG